jgi:hypothetical protein
MHGLYHFNYPYNKGRATDPVLCFADPESKNLDIVKTIRKKLKALMYHIFLNLSLIAHIAIRLGVVKTR